MATYKMKSLSFINRATKKYKGVIFDYGGVIVNDILGMFMAEEAKQGFPPWTILKASKEGGENSIGTRLNTGKITFKQAAQEFKEKIFKETGKTLDLTNYIEDNSEEIFKVNHEILQCNEILKKNGIKTAILSNAFLLKDGESALQIKDGLFEVVIDSCKVHLEKPDPRMYQLVLDKMDLKSDEVIFLDDMDMCIKGAETLGIKSIKVNPKEIMTAIKELEKLTGLVLTA